jgi:hypothetical protein
MGLPLQQMRPRPALVHKTMTPVSSSWYVGISAVPGRSGGTLRLELAKRGATDEPLQSMLAASMLSRFLTVLDEELDLLDLNVAEAELLFHALEPYEFLKPSRQLMPHEVKEQIMKRDLVRQLGLTNEIAAGPNSSIRCSRVCCCATIQ